MLEVLKQSVAGLLTCLVGHFGTTRRVTQGTTIVDPAIVACTWL